jgi:hypothetical protein
MHPNLAQWEQAGYRAGNCPETEIASAEVVNLPTHDGLTADEIRRIVTIVVDHGTAASSAGGRVSSVSSRASASAAEGREEL